MADAIDAVASAIKEVTKARKVIQQVSTKQVGANEDKDYIKSVVLTWSKTHRPIVASHESQPDLSAVDEEFASLLSATNRYSAKSTYLDGLGMAKKALDEVQSAVLLNRSKPPATPSGDAPPNFAPLAPDKKMQDILVRRWNECQQCARAHAPLAATVMMGGLLEALFVARANQMTDKAPLFKCSGTPKDRKTQVPIPLTEWTLKPYIDVGHELKWITTPSKDVGVVLRDYRNYVHPYKEYSQGVVLTDDDSQMFWEVTKSLCRQILTKV